ncbi:MAG: patatin-like protein [Rhodospirillaceae bacterium]
MKEKELRLALVVYGGVSLAVYMHGITKEILKLVRASRDRTALNSGSLKYDRDDIKDTENVYAELINAFEPVIDLRVVVDIISGASAGGINGIILSRALAHDLDIDPVRSFWLREMDVTALINKRAQAGPWNKIAFRPIVWFLMWWYRKKLSGDHEFKYKLSTFLRSRWFKPPFDGAHLTQILFDGISAMGDPSDKIRSLLPAGLALDLFVMTTDFFGFRKETPIHNPPTVIEREHRQVIKLRYQQWPPGKVVTDFDRDNIPALAFASRATSSFPGAFPPAQLGECDQLIRDKGIVWNSRVDFLYNNFRPYLSESLNPANAAFIDGSVLVNKPFAQAIRAIGGRPAYRQVDRRILYIDPHPRGPRNEEWGKMPGFFRTLKGALSDIPRNEPIHEDLAWIDAYNKDVTRLQSVIETSRMHVKAIVATVADKLLEKKLDGSTVGTLRKAVNAKARSETGFAYDGYLRLRIDGVIDNISSFLATSCGINLKSIGYSNIKAAINNWAETNNIVSPRITSVSPSASNESEPPRSAFLLNFDAEYRQRRLRFTIRTINNLYARLGDKGMSDLKSADLDNLKVELYETLNMMASFSDSSRTPSELVTEHIRGLVREISVKGTLKGKDPVEQETNELVQFTIDELAAKLSFEEHAENADDIVATLTNELPFPVREEILESYIGFAAWDVLTFSVTNWGDLNEFNEIRVDRVSPDDALTLCPGGAPACLKGIQFNHFAAFFSQAYRENDYLWGRLHGAERLIDIVIDAARVENAASDIDVANIKRRAFMAILESEKCELPNCEHLITDLKGKVSIL